MSDPEFLPPLSKSIPDDPPSKGPSLTLLYSLIALALAAAIGFALLIVAPFYRRR
ncbi:MAG: hypothetical protein ABSE99_18035 [Terracidiphilus sp.]|jgi:hypothetical protein